MQNTIIGFALEQLLAYRSCVQGRVRLFFRETWSNRTTASLKARFSLPFFSQFWPLGNSMFVRCGNLALTVFGRYFAPKYFELVR